MEVIHKSIKCSSKEAYYQLHLNIINPLLPNKLTEKEILILSSFMSIDEKLVEDDRFNSLVRKKVMEKHKLSPGGLSNHLKSMIKKGFLSRSNVTGRIKVKSFVNPGDNMQGYKFRIGYQIVKNNIEKAIQKEQKAESEKESPIDELMPTQAEINKALAEQHNNFDESIDITQDEDEEGTPYKMKD